MPRPQFSLKTLLWLMVCVGCFFAGKEWQRQYDEHWWAGATGPGKDDFTVTVKRDDPGQDQTTTTVEWGDGKVVTFEGGRLPEWIPDAIKAESLGTSSSYSTPTASERRAAEEDYSLPRGALDR
jgi:hypothetical protein